MTMVTPIGRADTGAATRRERVGVLLVNLGTPDTADARGVRVYLKEFLSDPRVIENQGLLWKLILNGIILRIRPRRKARDYQKIWNTEKNESPLKTITRAQAEKLADAHRDHDHRRGRLGDALRQPVDPLADRCADRARLRSHAGRAALSAIFGGDHGDGLRRSVSRAGGHARAADAALRAALLRRSDYIDALATSINAHLATLSFKPETDRRVLSRHAAGICRQGRSIPGAMRGDDRELAQRMGLDPTRLMLTFQSRFGFDEWLQPYTDKTIEALAKIGVKRIAVVTPGFAADCLETLEEIAQENAEIFKHNGGEQFASFPA